MGSEHKIVVVFADTVFTVATFVPPFVLSQHSNAHPNRNLFPVVFHIPFSDLKITEIEKNEREKPEFSIQRLSLYGRPSIKKAVVLDSKLVKNLKDNFQKHMAVMGSRLALQFLEGNLAVADSLAHCVHISPCRKIVKCIFQSEPLVSEVATTIMNSTLNMHLNSLLKSFQSRTIEIGRTGEILAQLILLMAHDYSYSEVNNEILGSERISIEDKANSVPLSSLLKLLVRDFDSNNEFFTRKLEKKNYMNDVIIYSGEFGGIFVRFLQSLYRIIKKSKYQLVFQN